MNFIDPADLNDALAALTRVMLRLLESKDARRLSSLCDVSRTAQQLIRATSMRVEDFDNPSRMMRNHFAEKRMGSDKMKPVLVPQGLASEASAALAAIELTIAATLYSDRPQRFSEVERLGAVAQLLIQAVEKPKPASPRKPKQEIDDPNIAFVCGALEDDEEYPQEDRPPDQLQRDYIETQADARRSTVAAAEASELASLLQLLDDPRDRHNIGDAARARVAHLKSRLAARSLKDKENGVVHSDVSRGHQPDREGAGDDHRPRIQADAQREQGDDQPAGARPGVAVGIEAVVHA